MANGFDYYAAASAATDRRTREALLVEAQRIEDRERPSGVVVEIRVSRG